MNTRQRWVRTPLTLATLIMVMGCASMHLGGAHGYTRPSSLVGEWIDVENTSPADSSIWVLRENGYFAHARLHLVQDGNGSMRLEHQEVRNASWYFDGTLGDASRQSLCFSKRLGRFGAACYRFTIDTLREVAGSTARLAVHGYGGDRDTSVRVFVSPLSNGEKHNNER